MRRIAVVAAVFLWPAAADAQQMYTNADLVRFHVPGAYTNEDLRKLPPAPRVPAGRAAALPAYQPAEVDVRLLQAAYDGLVLRRLRLAEDRQIEWGRIEFSESAFAGDTRDVTPRLGYRTQAAELLLDLDRRIAILDAEIEFTLALARRAGATLERRDY